jgi:multidrug efflux pump subunit AcrA (membrane-fusion protein)
VTSRWISPVRAGVVAATVPALLVAGCSADEEPQVQVAEVTRGTVVEVVEAPATVTARATATLTAAADGTVAEIMVPDGEQADAGQVVLRIDSPEAEQTLAAALEADAQAAASAQVEVPGLAPSEAAARADQRAAESMEAARAAAAQIPDEAARAEALAALARAEADYAALRADAERAVQRFNAGLGSLAEALGSLSQAQRVQTEAAVGVAQRTVDALVVVSPVSGIVSLGTAGASSGGGTSLPGLPPELAGAAEEALGAAGSSSAGGQGPVTTLTVGAPVTAGQPVVTVTDVSTLSLAAQVDETDVLLVTSGVPATVELDALPGATYEATVSSVDVAPTSGTAGGVSYVVRLGLEGGSTDDGDPAPTPLPGMSAVVDLRVREATDVVAVPVSAVIREGERDAVWVVVDDVVRQRFVRLGAQGETTVEVTEGLQVGERVVVEGADRVSDGQSLEP